MKTYIEKRFDKDSLKNIDIQNVGVYYSVPASDIVEEKRAEFDIDDVDSAYVVLDKNTIDSGNYVEDYSNIDYDYTDMDEWEYFISELMNCKKYNNYLVVGYNSRWDGATGYSFITDYKNCFIRDYDVTQYVTGSSKGGKCLELREYSHDVPTGHRVLIIGLTEAESNKLEYADFDTVLEFANKNNTTISL
jgi:hypothetical protein